MRLSLLRRAALLTGLCLAAASFAQSPAPGPRKIAISSRVGDQLSISVARDSVGTNIASNAVDLIKLPGPALDLAVLALVQEELQKANPKPELATLQVAPEGSPLDPAKAVVDGKVVADNPLIVALRQEGFTHLVTATKVRTRNVVRLANAQQVGRGQLEGLGFYLDFGIRTQLVGTTAGQSQGLIAPFAYVDLTLVDIAAMQVVGKQSITANTVYTPTTNPTASQNPWDVMTSDQKMRAIQDLLVRSVPPAVQALTPAR